MGYTHYWYRKQRLDPTKFAAFAEDLSKVVPELEKIGVRIAGWDGSGQAKISWAEISFNGVEDCGHPQKDLGIAWPAKNAGGVGKAAVAGTWFAGATLETRSCGGDCSHETFVIERDFDFKDHEWRRKDASENGGMIFAFCKTAFKPYDLAVTAALVILKHHFGSAVRISSDGGKSEWFDAALLCHKTLGYGLDFKLDKDK